MELEVIAQVISITKNNSGIRFAVPSSDPAKPGPLVVVSFISEQLAKTFYADRRYIITIEAAPEG